MMTGRENDRGTNPDERKSRTRKKKEALSLQELGERLLELSSEQVKGMGLPPEIVEALSAARTIRSRSARRRQMQYIGSLMRKVDAEPIREALQDIEGGSRRMSLAFKQTEAWRDELVSGNRVLLERILEKNPEADRRHLTHLVRQAISERESGRPPRASRALFRYLRGMMAD